MCVCETSCRAAAGCVLFKTRDYLPTVRFGSDRQERERDETKLERDRAESSRVESNRASRQGFPRNPLPPPPSSSLRHSMIYRNICRALFFLLFCLPIFFFFFFICFHFDGGWSKISVENAPGNFSPRSMKYMGIRSTLGRYSFDSVMRSDPRPDKESTLPATIREFFRSAHGLYPLRE